MAEETEGSESGAEAIAAGVDPAAMALALGGAGRDRADAFLKDQQTLIADQRALIAIQKHHLHRQFTQLDLNIWQQRLGVLLRVATAVMGFALAAGLAFMVWDGAHSNGLLIEPFSVPPDLASRGLTGQVVAAKLLDSLSEMQAHTGSMRAPATYANSWTQRDIKIDIPDTGVSLAELDSFLREKLGHDIHVTGEIVRTASGLNLTARAGEDGAQSVAGPDAELDGLVQRLAESVYRITQPYRYAIYLASHDRVAEAVPIFKALATSGPARERPWAYYGWSNAISDSDTDDAVPRLYQRAIQLEPDNLLIQKNIGLQDQRSGRPEQAVRDFRKVLPLLDGNSQKIISADAVIPAREQAQAAIDSLTGAFHDAARENASVIDSGVSGLTTSFDLAGAQTGEHDLGAARATMADPMTGRETLIVGMLAIGNIVAKMQIAGEAGDWPGVLSQAAALDPLLPKYPGRRILVQAQAAPLIAYAQAKLGNFAAAEARIAAMPADCYDCLITRARIADLKGEHARADWWFARAIQDAPSIPFAYAGWGQAALARGDTQGAITKFALANQKGPHFADPLEMWGEALVMQKQPDLALAKFEAAANYAPNWGHLHLKWGEALVDAGKPDEAERQFAAAAGLDLVAADKSELTRIRQRAALPHP